jgi:pimeloyl-ACP methyl ester carboxylesterase
VCAFLKGLGFSAAGSLLVAGLWKVLLCLHLSLFTDPIVAVGHGRKLTPLLRAAGHEVYAPTLTGLSERSHLVHCGVDLTTHITDITNLIAYEDLADIILVGNGYGGMVITGVAATAPERLKIIIYCTGNPTTTPDVFGTFALKAREKDWDVQEIPTGHLAMLTAPKELAELLLAMSEHA